MAKPQSSSQSFWDHPIINIEEALHIRKQIEALQTRLAKLIGGDTEETVSRRVVKRRRRQPAPTTASKAPFQAAVGKPKAKKKGGLTPEGRAKLAASMRARWAAKRKAAGQ